MTHLHIPHPHLEHRAESGPVRTADQHAPGSGLYGRFNRAVAVWATDKVGSMTCAYLFAGLALVSLPDAVRGGTAPLIQWIAQTFFQLVLLSVILVGQKVQSVAGDARAQATYDDGEALLHYADGAARALAALHSKIDALAPATAPQPAVPAQRDGEQVDAS